MGTLCSWDSPAELSLSWTEEQVLYRPDWMWAALEIGADLGEMAVFSQGLSYGIPNEHLPHTQHLGNRVPHLREQDLATTASTHYLILVNAPAKLGTNLNIY